MEQKELGHYLKILREAVRRRGLRHSQQREAILRVLFHATCHLTPEEIHKRVKAECGSIGIATVYRTLAFLEQEKLVCGIYFEKDGKKYELNRGGHHDHLICIECGKIVEFFDDELERIQERIAKEAGFELLTHQMNLYGRCKECRTNRPDT
jgi:Fur family ferric uptake transcriptional regulator